MNLLIISHTPHYRQNRKIVGWGSTIREVDQLATLFTNVTHLAPLHPEPPPGSALPYTQNNVRFVPVKPAGGNQLVNKLNIIARIPQWLSAIRREVRRADALHIRCPAAISMLGLIGAWIWGKRKPVWVKYAGNWGSYPGKPFSYRLQQAYLTRSSHNWVVTINGHIPDQPDHFLTFANPSFSIKEYQGAKEVGLTKEMSLPIKLLFVGRVSPAKGVDRLLEIADQLHQRAVPFELTIVGDGDECLKYQSMMSRLGLDVFVTFTGWQSMTELSKYYGNAHIILLPSISEGWPKVLSEAMAFGAVPIASEVGSIPEIFKRTEAGLAIPPGDVDAYVDAIIKYTHDVNAWKRASLNGVQAAKEFTYEHYLSAVKEIFQSKWKLDISCE